MNKIKNPILFFTLCLTAFLILALASFTLSTPVNAIEGAQQEKARNALQAN